MLGVAPLMRHPVPDVGPRSRIVKTRLTEWVKLAVYRARGWV